MRHFFGCIVLMVTFLVISSSAEAETKMLDVTVTYRERVALPPDAQLDVQLLDVSRAGTRSERIASQRFAVMTVPVALALTYDAQIIDDNRSYAVVASIWSGNDQIFRTTTSHDAFGNDPVQIVLSMVEDAGENDLLPRSVSGISWAVTEIEGVAWINDDPATLLIDDEGNFSAYGGCNRFIGQLLPSESGVAFPQTFAGTMMACSNEVEEFERSFISALVRVTDYVRYGAGLVMTDAAGNALVHFVERPE